MAENTAETTTETTTRADDTAIEAANVLTQLFQRAIEQPIKVTENSLRDGEQFPGVAYTVADKIAIAQALAEVGIYGMSLGFPAVSQGERDTVKELMALNLKIPRIWAIARLVKSDIDHVLECGLSWLGTFVSTSDWHMRDKLRMTEEQVLARMEEQIPYAIACGVNVAIGFEDASRTPLPRLLRLVKTAVDLGVHTIFIADTVGILTPSATYGLFSLLRKMVPCELATHFHNDLGMSTANAIAALEAGADLVDCTLAGLGERAGNTPLEELLVTLRVKYGRDLGMRLDKLPEAARILSEAAKMPMATNKPIFGDNVFSHESGIHVHGLLANPICYQPFPPALIGREHRFIYGKHSGLASIAHLTRREGIELSKSQLEQVLERVKRTAESKVPVSEGDVLSWALAASQDMAS